MSTTSRSRPPRRPRSARCHGTGHGTARPRKRGGTRLAVFSIREDPKGGSVWVRAGSAFVNKDGSLNVLLDVLPLDGKLHVRDSGPQTEPKAS